MNARQIIEEEGARKRESPKEVFHRALGRVTYGALANVLLPAGFKRAERAGTPGFWLEKRLPPSRDAESFGYFVIATDAHEGWLLFYRDLGDGRGMRYTETLTCKTIDSMLKHLRLFRLIEGDPKRAFRAAPPRNFVRRI